MSNDATEQPGGRPEQHGPEMDDDQVRATNDLVDQLPQAEPGDGDGAGEADGRGDGGGGS